MEKNVRVGILINQLDKNLGELDSLFDDHCNDEPNQDNFDEIIDTIHHIHFNAWCCFDELKKLIKK